MNENRKIIERLDVQIAVSVLKFRRTARLSKRVPA